MRDRHSYRLSDLDMPEFTKTKVFSLKDHPDFDEKWVGDRIAEDPALLGLGDLILLERERRQEKAGRLDLLLEDDSGDQRYEVELMLGATDESHVIRCIEYWDIERRRYPAYDHCAVLVAEDVTARFLNVLGLVAGSVPLIAIQLTALEVEGKIALIPIKVLDARALLREDTDIKAAIKADRAQWTTQNPQTLAVAEACLTLINDKSNQKFGLNYTQQYIGLLDGNRARVFTIFWPRKSSASVEVYVDDAESWIKRLQDGAIAAKATNWGSLRFMLTETDCNLNGKKETVSVLLASAVQRYLAS